MSLSPFGKHESPSSQKSVELVESCIDFPAYVQSLRQSISDPLACKKLVREQQALLNESYRLGGDIGSLVRFRARLIDALIQELWCSLSEKREHSDLALVAVGGFGRGELHPYSDVDVLLLLAKSADAERQDLIAKFVALLWDCGLNPGHSVRTLKECVQAAKDDVTIMTSILESRVLLGSTELHEQLLDKTSARHMWPPEKFFSAKWDEQRERYQSLSGPDHSLEPNIKTSPGGLRDIQTIIWIARRFWGVGDIQALIDKDFLNTAEAISFREGLEFLWRVRYALHVEADTLEDRLLFEHQLKIAEMLGYDTDDSNLAVEKFMESYYRCVTRLSVINDVLIQHIDEQVASASKPQQAVLLNERFHVRNGYIDIIDESMFKASLTPMLEVFVLMAEHSSILGIGASTIRMIRNYREKIDDSFRESPEATELFMRLLSSGYQVPKQLKRMRQYGVLSSYIPAFAQIVGRMQFDLFHIYTVDVHTLEVVQNVYDFAYKGSQQDYILAAKIINGNMRIEILYLAALFHDIAKGRGGDHSTLGAQDVRAFAARHNLGPVETSGIAWLVENHLLMSSVSQKQDLSDPDVIREFCRQVGSRTRLDYLFVLTVADIQGTNPELWTSWRASLLRQLYAAATRAFRRGLENPVNKSDLIAAKQNNASRLLQQKNVDIEAARALWQKQNDEYFLRETVDNVATMTEKILNRSNVDEPIIVIRPSYDFSAEEPITMISIYHKLVENRFSFITLAMEELNLNIYDARLLLAGDGMTLDTYYVLDLNQQSIPEGGALEKKIYDKLLHVITSADDRWFESEKPVSRRLRSFSWPAQTSFSNDEANGFSVLEVIAPDRPGLLTVVGQVFFEHKLRLHSAKISTLGERVEDVFFVTDRKDQLITDPLKIELIQEDLRAALDENTLQ